MAQPPLRIRSVACDGWSLSSAPSARAARALLTPEPHSSARSTASVASSSPPLPAPHVSSRRLPRVQRARNRKTPTHRRDPGFVQHTSYRWPRAAHYVRSRFVTAKTLLR
jgi:hypothetical protein